MTHPSKRKGNTFEREIVAAAINAGLIAERAWGSDGRALGHTETVDITINGWRIQAKRRARIAKWLKPPPGADITIVREDRGDTLAVVPLDILLSLIRSDAE